MFAVVAVAIAVAVVVAAFAAADTIFSCAVDIAGANAVAAAGTVMGGDIGGVAFGLSPVLAGCCGFSGAGIGIGAARVIADFPDAA